MQNQLETSNEGLVSDLQSQLRHLTEQNQLYQKEVAAIKEKMLTQQEQHQKLVDEYSNELSEVNEERCKFESWSERLEVEVKDQKTTIETLNQVMVERDTKIELCEKQLSDAGEQKMKYDRLLEELQTSINEQKIAMESLMKAASEKEEQFIEMQSTIDNLKDIITEKDEEIASLESLNDTATEKDGKIAELKNNVEKLKHTISEKDEKILSLVENLQEEEERLTPLAEENESLLITIESKSSEINEVKKALEVKEEELTAIKKALDEKELQFKKALATAKKLKFQLQKISKEKEEKEGLEVCINNVKVKSNLTVSESKRFV